MKPAEDGTRVGRDDIEALVSAVTRETTDARAGIFGPQSMSWAINRESALFLGAGRAALLQLAHPWVATALAQHSSLMAKPIARFHNTFRVVFTMIFGSLDQATTAAQHLHQLHTRIKGAMPADVARYPAGSVYEANEIDALRWVYATLIGSAVVAYECVMPRLTAQQLAAYYAESKTLASLFGLHSTAMPSDWDNFVIYCRVMEQSDALGVNDASREMANGLLSGAESWIHPPRWYRALTAEWLPQRFRTEFGIAYGDGERRAAESAQRRLPGIYRRLPGALRFVGPWHEAQARLNGRGAGLMTRANNRFWIGKGRLPFGETISH